MSVLQVGVLFLFTTAWYLLALLPAVRELLLKTDVRPLRVIGDYDGNAAHFAKSSLAFISANFPGKVTRSRGERVDGVLQNGDPYSLIPYSDEMIDLEAADLAGGSVRRVLISYAPVRLPAQVAAMSSFYSVGDVVGGLGSAYRALFSEANIWLAPNSVVLRWVHSEGVLVAYENSRLFGRVSAQRVIRLLPGCTFQRVAAPRIEFGNPVDIEPPSLAARTPVEVDSLPEPGMPRRVVRDSLVIPPGSFVSSDMVVFGSVRIGAGSWVAGSLKAWSDVYVETGARIDGSVVAQRDVFIGPNSSVRGPIIAERNILIEGPTSVGSTTQPSTVSAPCVYFTPGVVVYGSVWAREEGALVAAEAAPVPVASEVVAA